MAWYKDSRRHALSAKGIKSAQKCPCNLIPKKKDRHQIAIDSINSVLNKDLKFPYSHKYPKTKQGTQTTQYFSSKKEMREEIKRQKKWQKGLDECFMCGKWKKEGRTTRLDKRDAGDGLMGNMFICDACNRKYADDYYDDNY